MTSTSDSKKTKENKEKEKVIKQIKTNTEETNKDYIPKSKALVNKSHEVIIKQSDINSLLCLNYMTNDKNNFLKDLVNNVI